jgi:translation elongation factor P/translation initiation factor 5A
MATVSTSEFKGGLKLMMDGDPYTILENEFVKPGKGQAFNRVKLRNLKTGRVIERTFKSGDTFETADVVDTDMQFLYSDGEMWHFMVSETFEQYAADEAAVADAKVEKREENKIKKDALSQITLIENPDLLQGLSAIKSKQIVVAFAAETDISSDIDDAIRQARSKMLRKGADIIYLNDVSHGGIFGSDETAGWIITSEDVEEISHTQKKSLAHTLINHALQRVHQVP